MADKTFDVVIVGGGNKALILAMYLTKYGKLSVGIFEDRNELGGGWSQEEPAPGFIGNTCSMHHGAYYHVPTYWDFPEWEDYGAKYDYTPVSQGCTFSEDDRCVIQYTSFEDVDPTQEKTATELARFSERDADTYLKIWNLLKKKWEPYFFEHLFNPAPPPGVPDPFEKMFMDPSCEIDPVWAWMSPIQLSKIIWSDPHIRHAFMRANQSWGFQSDLSGAGFGAAIYTTFWVMSTSCWARGSSHSLAHASHKVIIGNGGKVYTNHPVEKILIENGKATGIRLTDGSEIAATKAVVSTVDPSQLCMDLIGKEHLPYDIVAKVEALERDWICLMWYSWAFKERPKYKSEAWNSDVWQAMWLVLGDMDIDTFRVESAERKLGMWPSKLNIGVAYHGTDTPTTPGDTVLGPPESDFVCLTEQFVPPAWKLTDAEWKKRETQHAEDVVKKIGEYAPNIDWDKVGGYMPVTPYHTARQCKNYAPAGNWCVIDNIPSQWGRFRPIPELARHKIPSIEGLYCTGSAWHPWGAAHSAQGYNCYKVMSEDMGLIKPWEKDGRPF